MKLEILSRFTNKNNLVLILVISVAASFGIFENLFVKAENRQKSSNSFLVTTGNDSAVNIEENRSPWIKMRQGKTIGSEYIGTESAIGQFENGSLRPTTLVSTDFNFDGYPDVISGFAGTNGGLITLHKGWKEAFAPEDEQVLAGLKNGEFPVSFEKEARVLEIPIAPDFIVSGKFVKDSTLDLIVASRQSRSVYLLTSNGKDGFNAPREIQLDGEVTAIAADSFNSSKAFSGLVIATKNAGGFQASIYDGSNEINSTKAQRIHLSNEIDSLVLTVPDGLTTDKDLFLLGGGELARISQIGKAVSNPTTIDLPFRVQGFATGEFIRDRLAKTEIAVLADNGSIYYLKNGSLDTRPFTESEMRESFAKNGRGRSVVKNSTDTESASANNWTIAEEQNLKIFNFSKQGSQTLLRKSYITGNETDDLLVINPAENKIQILFKEPNYAPDRLSFTGETRIENLTFPTEVSAALPMRLNVMGQQGFVFFSKGSLEPATVITAPSATFTVTTTTDENNGACSAAGTGCSVREAVIAANTAAGADMITVPSGTFTLTIAGINEDLAATGDLDIREALTITGNGSANTIIQAGTTTANGIDKVLSINPQFTSPFATSLTGFTVRFGRNQSSFVSGVGFGGGFDWEGSGTGTLTISNLIVTDNSTTDGEGGGIAATSATGSSFISVTGSTISNNDPDRTAANSPIGGGIFVGTATTFRLTNTVISNNNVVESGNQGEGGGLYAFAPASSAGKSFLTGSTVSGNTAPGDGGGMLSTQPIDFNSPTTISNNSSGRFGGGMWINHTNGTTVITKATMTGNSATTTGGAIYLASATTANVLNMSFSRIVGNTGGGFKGLAVDAGTANVQNNWWGCNTGPSAAPCDTAGVTNTGTANFNPWLQLRVTAATNPVVTGQTSALTASFLLNSAGTAIAASNLNVLIGLPITWGATGGTVTLADQSGGTVSLLDNTIQATGTAAATFTATSPGARTATGTVDNGTATANITVNKANTTVAINTHMPNPSPINTAFNVTYSVMVTAPGAGTPTGTVTVSDGVNSCMGTVAAGSCMITLTTAGMRTLTATYGSDANFNGNVSPGVSHTVTSVVAAQVSVGGRVLNANGSAVRNAIVTITDQNGEIRQTRTSSFGYFRFDDIEVGETYTINAEHKLYLFTPQIISVNEEIADLEITAQN